MLAFAALSTPELAERTMRDGNCVDHLCSLWVPPLDTALHLRPRCRGQQRHRRTCRGRIHQQEGDGDEPLLRPVSKVRYARSNR